MPEACNVTPLKICNLIPVLTVTPPAGGKHTLAPRFDTESEWIGGPGVLVADVMKDSPAEAAGIQRGDIITEVEGERVLGGNLRTVIYEMKPGDTITLKVFRFNPEKEEETEAFEETDIKVTLGETEEGIIVSISDNGPEIPSSDLLRIFDRFFR